MYEDGYPRVTAWYARMRARPSYQKAVADDFPPERLAELPAGAGFETVLIVLLIIFIVFVITDAAGATDLFPFIHPVKK